MVQGGQTVVNPWLIIGGVATSVCKPDEIIMPENAVIGDVIVLTKPLGTQVKFYSIKTYFNDSVLLVYVQRLPLMHING